MKQAAKKQLALFQCPDCDAEAEIEVPPLETPLAWWPRCVKCGAAIWLMYVFTAAL